MLVHRSNRAEQLADKLAQILAAALPSPFETETIVVQGQGMERWLSIEMARRLGILANAEFPFPGHLLRRVFEGIEGETTEDPGLVWALAECILALLEQDDLAAIRRYLEDDRGYARLVQLAERLAQTFVQYQTARPDLLHEWEIEGGGDFQGALWRRLRERHGVADPLQREGALYQWLQTHAGPPPGLPSRLSLFGISTLPPFHLRVFSALASRIPVHLFVLSPSRGYWADLRSQRESLRAQSGRVVSRADDTGPALLLSLGRLNRDFQALLESTVDYREDEADLYRENPDSTMLATVQNDILDLVDRGASGHLPPLEVKESDRSISIHSCHSPMRELEVLHDLLLDAFAKDPTLEPHDVAVMTPDIESYAPLIDAVFGGELVAGHRIPHHVADRHSRAISPVFDAFGRLLHLLTSRMAASEVLDLLSLPAVGQRFDIQDSEVSRLREWVVDSGIRWGLNADQRQHFGQPARAENTWAFGLDRLFLGYADDGEALFAGARAYDDMEGDAIDLLGRFSTFCEVLFTQHDDLAGERSLSDWAVQLQRAAEQMLVSSDETAADHQELRETLSAMAEAAERHQFTALLPLQTVRALVERAFGAVRSTRNFLSGGVTFCELMPMRSIPFRVVCLLGLNDGSFPRNPQTLGFDHIALEPRLGDRSARDDDRFLVLEALLSARQQLIVTYCGQSIRDNSVIPPSVVVDELLETLERSFVAPSGKLRKRVVVVHPLQPFSTRYYDQRDDKLFSYSHAYFEGAKSVAEPRGSEPPFVCSVLDDVPTGERTVTVDQLARFFADPTRVYLRRLGLSLRDEDKTPKDREPLEPDGLESWAVGSELLDPDRPLEEALERARAAGATPLGTLGDVFFEDMLPTVESLRRAAEEYRVGLPKPPLVVDAELGDSRIVGQLGSRWQNGRTEVTYSRLSGKHEVGLWVRHLVQCCFGEPERSILIARDSKKKVIVRSFVPAHEPWRYLRELVDLYWLGHRLPLCFFPKAADAYWVAHSKVMADADERAARVAGLEAAQKSFTSDRGTPGEAHQPTVRQVFNDCNPLADEFRPVETVPEGYLPFADLARRIFEPLRGHVEESGA